MSTVSFTITRVRTAGSGAAVRAHTHSGLVKKNNQEKQAPLKPAADSLSLSHSPPILHKRGLRLPVDPKRIPLGEGPPYSGLVNIYSSSRFTAVRAHPPPGTCNIFSSSRFRAVRAHPHSGLVKFSPSPPSRRGRGGSGACAHPPTTCQKKNNQEKKLLKSQQAPL